MRRDARGRGWLYEGRMHGRHRFAAILARLTLRRAPHRLTALESVLRRHHSRAVERVGHKNHCEGHYHDLSYGQHRQTRYMGERLKSSLWVRGINGGEQRKRNACAGKAAQAVESPRRLEFPGLAAWAKLFRTSGAGKGRISN